MRARACERERDISVREACVYVHKICHIFLQRSRWSSERWLMLNFLNDWSKKQALSEIITRDESWVFAYDPPMKCHTSHCQTTPRGHPKKQVMVTKSQQNIMLNTFSDNSKVVDHKSVRVRQECFLFLSSKFWSIWDTIQQKYGQTIGSCTMTMCPVIGPFQSTGSCSKEPNSNHLPATITLQMLLYANSGSLRESR